MIFDDPLLSNRAPFMVFFKGGSGGGASAAPAPVSTVPRAIAPVTERLSDFSSVSRDEKKKLANRKGIGATVLAGQKGTGQVGGAFQTTVGQKSLLGA